jgi:hypothetical protein
MKKLCALVAAAVTAGSGQAATLTLESVTANGLNDFTFSYEATLGPDEGVRTGDQFVIFDFDGYIDGSIFSGSGDFAVSAQNTSPGAIVTPGHDDDPNVTNLVFTYTGSGFRTSNGPVAAFDFPLFGARSRFSGLGLDAFFSLTTKNNPDAERNHPIYMLGSITVPRPAAVPEPATWAMMIGGLGMAGAALRRRTVAVRFGQA